MGYKICPSCGYKNPEKEILCKECMTDLTGVEPLNEEELDEKIDKKEAEHEDKTVVVYDSLILLGDGFSIIVRDGDIIGRQAIGSEYFKDFKTVSRKHAKFFKEKSKWFVEDLGSTNGTFVNNIIVSPGQKKEIQNEDIIKLSSQVILKVKL